MKVERISGKEYAEEFHSCNVFMSVVFSELNRHKVDDIHYLVFSDNKTRLGITLGERNDGLFSPFQLPSEVFAVIPTSVWRYMMRHLLCSNPMVVVWGNP